MLVGSVTYGVAGHAPCDVVVVRQTSSKAAGEIVAGADGSPASPQGLEFAFAEAELRGGRLRVVHARAQQGFDPVAQEGPGALKEALSDLRARHPDVTVAEELVHGHPVEVLREAAAGAELLVVGSHGHGTFAGMVPGSVSHALLHHAPCPLAVVRTAR
ncbi:universal stress protein [[Actinomadura] parvosata]|uniref:universal stress protein n=1 Tax=[Actinomadura] parvosata TaxID=1955412 RepID=UPI00406C374E